MSLELVNTASSNQIAALNELRESQTTDYFVKAVHRVFSELPQKMEVPEFRYPA